MDKGIYQKDFIYERKDPRPRGPLMGRTRIEKVYIKYCRPYRDDDDEPPIDEVWINGSRPKKKLADQLTLYVGDCFDGVTVENERLWDGIE